MNDKYDVVIIGAGISGLVSGCYLAKAGMKVLIVEQATKVGGYCGSFYRKNFVFDQGVHCLGSFREEGELRKIYTDLNLSEFVDIVRINPSEIVYGPDSKLYIFNDIGATVENLAKYYPKESGNIQNFFEEVSTSTLKDNIVKLREQTFETYLNKHFSDMHLKIILSTLIWNMWIPASEIAALAGVTFFREFILDGGYYPIGGMQKFSNALANRFEKLGGTLLLSKKATKIIVHNKIVKGVRIHDYYIDARFIVSNADAFETYFELVEKKDLGIQYIEELHKLKQCESAFIVYLAVKNINETNMEKCTALWHLPIYKNERTNFNIVNKDIDNQCFFILCPSIYDKTLAPENHKIVTLICGASYISKDFWDINKSKYADLLIKKASKLLPNLSSIILIREIATPYTLEKYSLNYKGAVHGWESTIGQTQNLIIKSISSIKNLYFSGHWVMERTGTGGVSVAAYRGKNTAKQILGCYKRERKNEHIFDTNVNR